MIYGLHQVVIKTRIGRLLPVLFLIAARERD